MRGFASKSKTIVSVSTVALASTVLMTACGNSAGPATTSTTPAPQQKVTLKLLTHASWIKGGMEAVVKDAAEKAGVNLQIEKIAEGEEGDTLIKTRFATNEKPDLLLYYANNSELIKLGKPEDNFVVQDDQPWIKNFDKQAWTGVMDVGGKFYSAPYGGVQAGVVFYNKKVFESLKLSVPKTYDDFIKVSEALKQAGKVPLYLAGKDAWTLQLIPIVGGATADYSSVVSQINDNKAKHNQLAGIKTGIQTQIDLKNQGYVNKSFLSDTYDAAQKALANGETGMYVMASWIMNDIVSKFPDKVNDIGAFVMPSKDGKKHLPLFAPNAMYVVKGKNQEAAQKFVNYFESLDTQNLYFSNEGGIPAIKGVTKTTLSPAEKEVKEFIDQGGGVVAYSAGLKYPNGDFAALVQGTLVNGGKSADEVLDAQQKEFEKNAKAKSDPNFK